MVMVVCECCNELTDRCADCNFDVFIISDDSGVGTCADCGLNNVMNGGN
jgi:hypothetical protein